MSTSTAVLHDPSLHQLPHQGGRQGLVRLKADCALAGVVVLERVPVGFHCGRTHEVEGAVVGGRPEGHKHPVKTEGGKPVADALFSLWRRGPDGASKFLQRRSLVIAQCFKVLVDGLWFARLGWSCAASSAAFCCFHALRLV